MWNETPPEDARQRWRNTLLDIPITYSIPTAALDALRALIEDGQMVYAYRAYGGEWNLYLIDARVPVADFAANWERTLARWHRARDGWN